MFDTPLTEAARACFTLVETLRENAPECRLGCKCCWCVGIEATEAAGKAFLQQQRYLDAPSDQPRRRMVG